MAKIKQKKPSFYLMLIVLSIFLAIFILAISLMRANLDVVKIYQKENELRKISFEVEIKRDDGSVERICYKMPQTGILPTNPLYGIKAVRNFLWLGMERNAAERIRLNLLLADKKIMESKLLAEKGNKVLANDSAKEAMIRLKEAAWIADKEESEEAKRQIYQAGLIYEYILRNQPENEGVKSLIEELAVWNEKQKEKCQ